MTALISKLFRRKEAGFLLTEVLIALIIASIVAIGASVMVVQLISVKSTNANNVTVTSNVESAAHYLVRDVQMAEVDVAEDEDGNNVITRGIGRTETEWLWLEWTWTDGDHHVAYVIEGDKLYRNHTIYDSSETPLSETSTLVAKYIDASLTDWELVIEEPDEETGESAKLAVEITISASTGGYKSASESRTIQVVPRITP